MSILKVLTGEADFQNLPFGAWYTVLQVHMQNGKSSRLLGLDPGYYNFEVLQVIKPRVVPHAY